MADEKKKLEWPYSWLASREPEAPIKDVEKLIEKINQSHVGDKGIYDSCACILRITTDAFKRRLISKRFKKSEYELLKAYIEEE